MTDEDRTSKLVSRIQDRSPAGIAVEIANLIRNGNLPIGTQLPSVRDLATALGVSPSTVSSAWRQLRAHRMVSGSRRNGVWVQGDQTSLRPVRYEGRGNFGPYAVTDLRLATPDRELLPPLQQALVHATNAKNLHSYAREVITPSLRDAVEAVWPYEAPAFIATNGGYDGLYLALISSVLPGAYVAVETPATVRILDIVDKVGARSIPVECDDEGPLPESLAAALKLKPSAFVFQPGSHATTGRALSKKRIAALTALLKKSDTLIIEDDGFGLISPEPATSFGKSFPERTVHIKSFSKSHGPDLRLAVMSGTAHVIDQVRGYRNFREGWTTRLLQEAVAWLLQDTESVACVERARAIYAQRNAALSRALTERQIPHSAGGLVAWVPVPSEQNALVTLASRGIAVNPGSPSALTKTAHLRIATGQLSNDFDRVADAVLAGLHDPGWQEPADADY
ncbi:aminotransferase class I/II-fold pyridoxal phosphate-dependent enzyme [Pandoraea sp. XJJ-1]|uniref:aminotransferase-like domain-containing protein n=1 Tax=Pandoraea sp. XJJ-1 TaxID=3002643 RepID=UPI00227DCB71|nr:aminotransferase class I/II-fold pyridoxal phosphate-dependent enzyme [Pandoraea sp. XJJ-1]WAL83696.1 aminotransferase class I/II-fold pyridoxal phosphate-dependent enzyme [Pandoraea sp. XJJ-1]